MFSAIFVFIFLDKCTSYLYNLLESTRYLYLYYGQKEKIYVKKLNTKQVVAGNRGRQMAVKAGKKAFGWHFWSTEEEHEYGYEMSSDGRNGHTTHKIIQWLEFRRLSPYSHNFLFNLTEVFDKIFSFFRRIFISFGIPLLVIALILGLVCQYGCDEADLGNIFLGAAKWLAIAYAVSIAGTLIFAGFGLLWRKAFKIDDKLKRIYGDDLAAACVFENE